MFLLWWQYLQEQDKCVTQEAKFKNQTDDLPSIYYSLSLCI